jgi:hypothetical protein
VGAFKTHQPHVEAPGTFILTGLYINTCVKRQRGWEAFQAGLADESEDLEDADRLNGCF